jgi:PleD family two-component response regulator
VKQNAAAKVTTAPATDPLGMNAVSVLFINGSSSNANSESDATNWGSLEPFRVTRKSNLAQGLDGLQDAAFQLILLDLAVPDASTLESVTQVLLLAKDSPVIVLLNEGETTKAAEVMRLGAQDYVLQGCRCNSLMRTMKYALDRKLLVREMEEERTRNANDKEQLLSHLSHELRNALACIHQFGNILMGGLAGEMSTEQRGYIRIMLQNATGITNIVKGLMDAPEGYPGSSD